MFVFVICQELLLTLAVRGRYYHYMSLIVFPMFSLSAGANMPSVRE